jgi:opacity protein-like surface antigen
MKYKVFVFLFLVVSLALNAQRKSDIGLIAGGSYYQGDINPEKLFYKPGFHIGPIFRYNFNSHYSLRFKAVYASVKGSDADFDFVLTKRNDPVTFSNQFVNISGQFEYNFFAYNTGVTAGDWTPYLFGGLGYSFILSSAVTGSGITSGRHLTMPFGIGSKVNLTRRLSAGMEWSYNKTFNDRFDGVLSPLGETKFYNNDWYSFIGLFISYKFFKFAADCPAYD